MKEPPLTSPTDDERRAAACMAMARAPGLIRFAARYTRSLHDAEDAYQRAMEIALRRAPVCEPRRFIAWLHTVLRNEAIAVARARRREEPGSEADVADVCAEEVEDGLAVDAVAEWRERYRSIQDGLAALTEAQRICLILQSAGASYRHICEVTGYSPRKVERSVLEGRASLHAWEVRLSSGDVCERLTPVIDRVVTGDATARERRSVARHVRHCGPCRALLRGRRESNEWLAALAPLALVAGEALGSRPPDPSPVLAWWERLAGGATVRAGNAVQIAMDLPSSALGKVGAGTAAVAVAGAAGAPLVVDAVRPGTPEPRVAAIERTAPARAEARTAAPSEKSTTKAAPFPAARRTATVTREARRARSARRTTAQVRVSTPPDPPPDPPPARRPATGSAAPSPAPATAQPSQALALEFGP
jgi:RNA polymerase sigma factor (sigma-70 family)